MTNLVAGSTVMFKLDDDTESPGLARVRLLREKAQMSAVLPWKVWTAEVLEVVKPSATRKGQLKTGKRLDVGEKHLIAE